MHYFFFKAFNLTLLPQSLQRAISTCRYIVYVSLVLCFHLCATSHASLVLMFGQNYIFIRIECHGANAAPTSVSCYFAPSVDHIEKYTRVVAFGSQVSSDQ